jgi:hypothetical protein
MAGTTTPAWSCLISTGSVGTGGDFTGTVEKDDSFRCEASANDGVDDGTSLDVTVTIGS